MEEQFDIKEPYCNHTYSYCNVNISCFNDVGNEFCVTLLTLILFHDYGKISYLIETVIYSCGKINTLI